MPKSVLFLVVLFFAVSSVNSAPRMVVGELFTNTSCGPCRPANLTLDQIVQDCSTYLAVIRYHTWWPSAYDPFYYANIAENRARTQFYGTNYVPRLMIDGFWDAGYNHPTWRSMIDDRATLVSPLRIVVTAQYQSEGRSARAIAKVYNESNQPVSGRLHFVLTETGIYYPAPNGSTIHNQTFHDMIPDQYGEIVTIPANDSITRTRDFVIRDTTWLDPPSNTWPHITAHDSCQVVVFLQDQSTNEIYQGGKAWLTPGLGISERSTLKAQRSTLSTFPNPFTTTLHIKSLNPKIRIYDACGNLVKQLLGTSPNATKSTTITLDSRDMQPGIYFVENGNSRVKVLKVK